MSAFLSFYALTIPSIAGESPTPAEVTDAFRALLGEKEVQDAASAVLMEQIRSGQPVAVIGGWAAVPVSLEEVFEAPPVYKSLGDKLDIELDGPLLAQQDALGLALIPPRLVREIGASWSDRYIDAGLDALEDQMTDIFGVDDAVVGTGIAIFAIGAAAYYVFDTLFAEPDPRANCTGSATDCDNDGNPDKTDANDDGDNYVDTQDDYPFDNTKHICDLCGNGATKGIRQTYLTTEPEISDAVTELTVGLLEAGLAADRVALGVVDDFGMSFYAP